MRVSALPLFYRADPLHTHQNDIAVRIFRLAHGHACVVSWPLPEPGLRAFSPSTEEPETMRVALPYAQFLLQHVGAARVVVELDNDVEWQDSWGALLEPVPQ